MILPVASDVAEATVAPFCRSNGDAASTPLHAEKLHTWFDAVLVAVTVWAVPTVVGVLHQRQTARPLPVRVVSLFHVLLLLSVMVGVAAVGFHDTCTSSRFAPVESSVLVAAPSVPVKKADVRSAMAMR